MVEDRGTITHEPLGVQALGNTNTDGSGTNRIMKLDSYGNQGIVLYDEDNNPINSSNPLQVTSLTTPTIYNITMTGADTEYSRVLPENTKYVEFRCRDPAITTRYAYETGKVATPISPYKTLLAGEIKSIERTNLTSTTLYFASETANKIMEIEVWT